MGILPFFTFQSMGESFLFLICLCLPSPAVRFSACKHYSAEGQWEETSPEYKERKKI
jgi:hypothetical protein